MPARSRPNLKWGSGSFWVELLPTGVQRRSIGASQAIAVAGAGLGATTGIVLTRRGFAVDPLGMTVTIAIGGAVLAVEPRYSSVLGDARFYALLLGVIGLANLRLAGLAGGDLPNSQRNP